MSREIDEKVVSLEFDNKNFEQNTRESLKTLDKLKESLKFEGVKEGSEKALKAMKPLESVDFSKMQKGLEIISSHFDQLGIKPTAVFRNIQKEVAKTATGLINMVRNDTFGNIYSGGLNRAMKLADARFKLSGTLKTAEELDAVMESVNYGVADTAYSLDEAAAVAAQLTATGIRGGKEMDGILRGISGTAAMTGSSYEEIGHIFTKVSGNGKLMNEELQQLSTRGLNAAANLAEVFNTAISDPSKLKSSAMTQEVIDSIKKLSTQANITEADIHTFATKGKIDFKMFAASMDEAFGEHAKKANETLKGVWSNMRSAFAKIGADFLTPIVDNNSPLVHFLEAVRKRVAAVRDGLKPFMEYLASGVNGIIKLGTSFIETFKIEEITKGISDFFQGIRENADQIISRIRNMLQPWEHFKDIIKEAGVDVTKFKEQFIKIGEANKWFEKGTITVKNFKDHLRDGWFTAENFNKVLKSLGSTTKKQAKDTGDYSKELERMQKVVDEVWHGDWGNMWDRWNALKAAGYDYVKVQELVNKTVDKHRLTLKDLGIESGKDIKITEKEIEALLELEKMASTSGTDLNNMFDDLNRVTTFDLLKQSVSNVTDGVKRLSGAITDGLVKGFKDNYLLTALDSVLHEILSITSNIKLTDTAVARIKNTVAGFTKLFVQIVSSVMDIFTTVFGLIHGTGDTITALIELLTGGMSLLGDLASEAADWIGVMKNKLLDFIRVSNLKEHLDKGFDWLVKSIKKIGNFLARLTSSDIFKFFSAATAAIMEWMGAALDRIASALSVIFGYLSNTFGKVSSVFSNVISMFGRWIKQIGEIKGVQHIMDILSSSFRKLSTHIMSLFGVGKDKVDKFFAAFGKGKGAESLLESLDKKVTEFLKSIQDWDFDLSGLEKSLSQLKEKIQNTLSGDNWKEIGINIVQGLREGLFNNFGGMIGWFVDKANVMINAFKDTFGIHSPSTVMMAIGGFIISGLVIGMENGLFSISETGDVISNFTKDSITKSMMNTVKDISPTVNKIWSTLGDTVVRNLETLSLNDVAMVGGLVTFSKAVKDTTSIMDRFVGKSAQMGSEGTGIIGMMDAFADLTKSVKQIPTSIGGVFNTFSETIKKVGESYAETRKLYVQVAKKKINAVLLAEVIIGIIAICYALKELSEVPADKLKNGEIALGCVAGALAVLMVVAKFGKADKVEANAKLMGAIALTVFAFGASIKMIVDAFTELYAITSEMSDDKLKAVGAAAGGIIGVVIVLGGVALALSKFGGSGVANSKMAQGAVYILAIAAAIDMMVFAFWALSKLDQSSIYRSTTALFAIGIMLGAIAWVTTKLNYQNHEQFEGIGKMFIEFGACMLLIAYAMKKLDEVSEEGIVKGIAVMTAVGILMGAFTIISRWGNDKAMDKAGNMFIKFSIAVGILAFAIMAINMLTPEMIMKGFAVMTLFTLLCGGLMIASQKAGEFGSSAGSMFLKFSAACIVMVLAIKAINYLKEEEIWQGIKVISMLEGLFAALMWVSQYAGEHASKAGTMFMKTAVALIILSGAIYLLGKMDQANMWSATGALTVLMLAFAALMYTTKDVKDENMNSLLKFVGSLATLFIGLGVLAIINSQYPVLPVAIAIGGIILALGWAMKAMSSVDKLPDGKLLFKMVGFVTAIGVVLVVLSALQKNFGTQDPLQLVVLIAGIAVLMEVLAHVTTQVSKISATGKKMDRLVKTMFQMGLVMGEIGTIMVLLSGLASSMKVSPAVMITVAGSMSAVMLALSESMAIISKVKIAKGSGNTAGAEMAKLAAWVGGIVLGIGAVTYALGELQAWSEGTNWDIVAGIKKGIDVTNAIADMIGEFFGHLIGSLLSGIDDSHAKSLERLAEGYKNFANSLADINPEAAAGAKRLFEVMWTMTKSNFVDAITFRGTQSEDLLESVSNIADAVITFNNKIKGQKFDTSNVGPAVEIASAIAEFEKALPKRGGLWGAIAGDRETLSQFSKGLEDFIDVIVRVNNKLKEIPLGTLQTGRIKKIAAAGTEVSKLANSLHRTGGLWEKIAGKQTNLEEFGGEVESFVKQILKICEGLQEVETDKINLSKLGKIKDAGTMFGDLASSLERSGGWTDTIFGTKETLSGFGENITNFVSGLVAMIELIPDGLNVTKAESLVTLSSSINDIQNNLKESGGAKGLLFGNKDDIGNFGENIEKFGVGLSNFAIAVQDVDTESLEQASTAVTMISTMATPEILDNFQPGTFALKLDQFCESMKDLKTNFTKLGIKDILKEINGLSDLANAIVAIGTNNIDLTSFLEAIEQLKSINLTELADSLANSGEVAGELSSVMSNIINEMAKSISDNGKSIVDAFKGVINKTSNSIRTDKFSSKGKQAVQSFKAGITHATSIATSAAATLGTAASNAMYNSSAAYTAGYNMGCKMAEGLKATWTEFVNVGTYLGQMARQYAEKAIKNSGGTKSVSATIAGGVTKTVANFTKASLNQLNEGVAQVANELPFVAMEPVITPVMDLDQINAEEIKLSNKMNMELDMSMTGISDLLFSVKDDIYKSNNEVIKAVNDLNDKISEFMNGDPSEISFYVDSKKLASTTAKNMNIELGKLSRRKVR